VGLHQCFDLRGRPGDWRTARQSEAGAFDDCPLDRIIGPGTVGKEYESRQTQIQQSSLVTVD
jgi:hypothetical protein